MGGIEEAKQKTIKDIATNLEATTWWKLFCCFLLFFCCFCCFLFVGVVECLCEFLFGVVLEEVCVVFVWRGFIV